MIMGRMRIKLLLILQLISTIGSSNSVLINDSSIEKGELGFRATNSMLTNDSSIEKGGLGFRVHMNRRDNHLGLSDRIRSAVFRSQTRIGNLTIGRSAKALNIAFGCGHNNQGKSHGNNGLVGLGRGPLSLLSQLGPKISYKFSYCLLPINSPHKLTSPLFFGQAADFRGGHTLTLVQNGLNPSLWYIPMTGVTVSGEALPIPLRAFKVKHGGNGGVIIDSGTTLTYFVRSIYRPLKKAIKRIVGLKPLKGPPMPLDLCYGTRPSRFPSVTFHFQGGIDMNLPLENFFLEAGSDLWCFAFAQSESFSVLGNLAQQNFHFHFDHAGNKISFKPENCTSL